MGFEKTEEPIVENIPRYKKALCGDHLFGNIFYPLWSTISCSCCIFFRGLLTGFVLTEIVHVAIAVLS
jgi:hypothetical protein